MINRCNTRPVTEAHGFRMPVDASMSANTRKAATMLGFIPPEVGAGFAGGDVNRTDQFEIQVECVPVVKTSKSEHKPDPHRTKVDVQNIDLFLSTYQVTESGPRGTTCKPLKVTTRIGTDKAGPKNVKLWRQVNGGLITSEEKQMHAEAAGDGKFGDDWNKFEHFTKTTTVQYKAEILGGTFAPSTPWKSITIHCNGDFAPTTNNNNPTFRRAAGRKRSFRRRSSRRLRRAAARPRRSVARRPASRPRRSPTSASSLPRKSASRRPKRSAAPRRKPTCAGARSR